MPPTGLVLDEVKLNMTFRFILYSSKMKNKMKTKQYHTIRTILNPIEKS